MKWSASVCLFWHILHLKQRIWLHSQKQLVKPWRYSAFPLYTLQRLWSAAPFLTHFLQMISFVCIRAGLTMALITFWHSTYILKWGELQWNSFKWDMMHLIGCVFTVFVGGGAPPPLCSHHLSSVNDQHMHSLLCGLWINTHYHESVCGVSVLLYICAQLSSIMDTWNVVWNTRSIKNELKESSFGPAHKFPHNQLIVCIIVLDLMKAWSISPSYYY